MRYLFPLYSLAISCLICVLASSRFPAFTAAKLKKITGYAPCSFRYVSSCQIESPSNRSARLAYFFEKKHSNILIFNVLPKRRGRVINVTTSRFSHHSFIKFVLSTKKQSCSLRSEKPCIPILIVFFICPPALLSLSIYDFNPISYLLHYNGITQRLQDKSPFPSTQDHLFYGAGFFCVLTIMPLK